MTRDRPSHGLVLSVAIVMLIALMVAAAAISAFSWAFTGEWEPWLAAKTSSSSATEAVRVALLVVAGMGGVVGLVVAYRRQKHLETVERSAVEDQMAKAKEQSSRDATRLFQERFREAATQMGGGSPIQRIAGAYAMAALADEAPTHRAQCLAVLTGYLRLPPVMAGTEREEGGQESGVEALQSLEGEFQVRREIQHLIRSHLTGDSSESWGDLPMNFRGAFLVDAHFEGAEFRSAADFSESTFSGVTNFSQCGFLDEVAFSNCTFKSTTFFRDCRFDSDPAFWDTTFVGYTDFGGSHFAKGARFGHVRFLDIAGFETAEFVEGVSFWGSQFHGDARFGGARFMSNNGRVHIGVPRPELVDLAFCRDAIFFECTFCGLAYFTSAEFAGYGDFRQCGFREVAEFEDLLGDTGCLDLSGATFEAAQRPSLRVSVRDNGPRILMEGGIASYFEAIGEAGAGLVEDTTPAPAAGEPAIRLE